MVYGHKSVFGTVLFRGEEMKKFQNTLEVANPQAVASAANMMDTLKVLRGMIYKSKIEDAAETLISALRLVENTILVEDGD